MIAGGCSERAATSAFVIGPRVNLSTASLADLLGYSEKKLDRLCGEAEDLYLVYPLQMGSKRRWIEAPRKQLKSVQRLLLDRLLYRLRPTRFAQGFVPGRSIVTHARQHCGQQIVITMDLRDFFPSVAASRVADAIEPLGLSEADASRIVALTTRRQRLPQGAPTSPHLANLACRGLDARLGGLASALGWAYSRYADDFTFSGPADPGHLVAAIEAIVRDEGFRVARHKTRVMGQHQRQMVTGLVVNDHVAVPREKRRLVRAMLHRAKTAAHLGSEVEGRWQLVGHLAFLAQIDPAGHGQALRELRALMRDPEPSGNARS